VKDYPFVKLAIFFILGIIAEKFFQFESLCYLIIALVSLPLFILIRIFAYKNIFKFTNAIISSVLFFFAGSFIANQNVNKINSPLSNYYKEKNSKLFAEVLDVELERSFEIVFTVRVDSIILDNKKFILTDKLICKFRGDTLQRRNLYNEINPGNKIFLTGSYQKGREKRNLGEFDYNNYLNSKGITGLFISYDSDSIKIITHSKDLFKSGILSLRKIIDKLLHKLHNAQTAGLLRGLILADRSEIDYETKNDFINSGVVHILAVSGLHVGYVMIIFVFVFGRFNIYTRAVLTIIGLVVFMFLTGVPPSVFRATLMSIIIIIAFLSNRSTNIINSISIAAVIILLFNPYEIYNPGFQLSFSAVLAIGILYPNFQRAISKLKIKNKFLEYVALFFAVSLSAQIGTLPFTLAYFSKLSLVALFANLIVIPVVGLIIGNAFITIVIGMISTGIGIYFGAANNLLSSLMIEFIRIAGNFNFSFLYIHQYSLYDSVIFYSVLGLLLFSLKRIQKYYLKIIITSIAFIIIFMYSTFDDKKLLQDNELNVLMIDVGQGDSFLIKFPNGKTALIDAGEATPFLDNGDRIIIPLLDYLGIEKIDYGFISHLDLDHYGGFVSLIYNNRIKEIYRPLPDSSSKSIRLEKFLKANKIKTNTYSKSSFNVGNTKLYILSDPYDFAYKKFSSNDKSGVIKIVFGKTSFLFVGDCEHPAEYYLATRFGKVLDSDVLKVGHHGSPTGSSEAFLNLVSPKISLISAGIKNKFNHPAESVLNSLRKIDSKIYRTDFSGAVLLQSDGKKIEHNNWNNK
jgi:competence protein ComEC